MSMSNNPPQLQLSLGHQTFKRSFHQFGLDVDDAEDSEAGTMSASSSSGSRSGSAAGNGHNGTRSVSSGSSYSSQAGDGYGYNGGDRNERNKRARSEGPEAAGVSAGSNAESMDEASVLSFPARIRTGDISGISQESPGGQGAPQESPNSGTSYQRVSSYDQTSGFTLPVFHFGPPTPSVAEFVALHSNGSNARTVEHPPGFAGMLSPRSSSPAPPPIDETDVAMRDDEDDDPFRPFESRINVQNSGPVPFLNTARSDALLNSATERLRSAMDRARTFDRMLAPLRSDAADATTASSQGLSRPRLPPFDFEAHRRASSPPPYDDQNLNLSTAVSNPFDRSPHQSSATGAVSSGYSVRPDSTSAERTSSAGIRTWRRYRRPSVDPFRNTLRLGIDGEDIENEEEDDIVVDRELAVDTDLHNATRPRAVENSSSGVGSRSLLRSRDPSLEGTGRLDVSARAIEDRVRAINSLTDRTIDDLTSFISTNETEDARPSSFFDTSHLDPRLSTEQSDGNSRRRLDEHTQGNIPAARTSSETSAHNPYSFSSGIYGSSSSVRPIPHPMWNRSRDRAQDEAGRLGTNAEPMQGWPWIASRDPPSLDSSIPGLGLRTGSEAHADAPLSSRSQYQPHSPTLHLPLFASSRPGPASPETENDVRRIERMVHLDMESDVRPRLHSQSGVPPPLPRRPREDNHAPTRSRLWTTQESSPAHPPQLPTLRSAILGPLRDADNSGDLLGEGRYGQADDGTAYASASAVAPSMSSSGLRSRSSHGEHGPMRSSLLELEGRSHEQREHSQREVSGAVLERRHQEARTLANTFADMPPLLSDDNRIGWPRASRNDEGATERDSPGRLFPSRFTPQNAQSRELALEASERRRLLIDSWFPASLGDDRIREAERTRLREMRERHRLSIHTRPSLLDRTERPTPPQGERPDARRWANLWAETVHSSTASAEATLFNPEDHYLRPEVGPSDSVSNGVSSSTEAAAFFASGPSYGSSRHSHGHLSPAVLRQRRLRLLSGLEDNTQSAPRDEPWDDFEMNIDPTDTYGFGRELHRSPSPIARPERVASSPSDDLLQLLYQGRSVQDTDTSQHRPNLGSNDVPSSRRASDEFDFSDLPPLEESRVRTWNVQRPSQRPQDANPSGPLHRSTSLRNTSRPPSLPPLRFERLSAMTTEGETERAENRLFGSEEPTASRVFPWRRSIARPDWRSDFLTSNSTARSALQRNGDLAMHHALMLQSVQARQATTHEQERERQLGPVAPSAPAPPSGRSHSFQHAMNILGADGLSNSRRQQFNGAFERERDRDRSRPPRIDTHVRWGEIADDSTDTRPSAHSPRSWAEAFRSRRRSMSALFAPPPDNADNAPPNRARGTGTAAGEQNNQTQTSSPPHDWFSMISSNRARMRYRARLGRTDDEPSQRSFFRFGRSRAGLRNLGDFVRDEDFDTSYESLIALAATLGDVKPRATPAHVLNALPNGLFKDWQSPGCDTRCPICLDDYKDVDPLLKAEPCNHWCHKECLEQWLHTAQTCPVCRTKIKSSQRIATPPPVAGPSRINRSENSDDAGDDSDDDLSFISSSPRRISRALYEALSSNSLPRSPLP